MWEQIFSFNNNLYGVGLENRFDWPTNISVFELNEDGVVRKIKNEIDRGVIKVKVFNNYVFVLFEDSGKQSLLKTDFKDYEFLSDEESIISDFTVYDDKIYTLKNSFNLKDEVYIGLNKQTKKISEFNSCGFMNKSEESHKLKIIIENTYPPITTE